jgi:hypothetical protein
MVEHSRSEEFAGDILKTLKTTLAPGTGSPDSLTTTPPICVPRVNLVV